MIEVRHLTKHFDRVTAVDNLSFRVKTGETLALIGTSGCGKTTTLKMINRLIEPSAGEVLVDGENVLDQPVEVLRRHMGYVIQKTGLFPHYTIERNIGVVPQLLGWPKQKIKQRTNQLLEQLGLPPGEFIGKYPDQLSGGQQQRIGIARALAADPPIVLMDEPFGALDPITRRVIRRDFKELEELTSKTTILVTHDVEEAFEMADQICLLDQGQVQQLGTPKALLFRPSNDFVADFLAGQQMQLEMEVVTLGQLVGHFQKTPLNKPGGEILFKAADPVRSAMDRLNAEKKRNSTGKMAINGQPGYFDLPLLLEAFFQYLKKH